MHSSQKLWLAGLAFGLAGVANAAPVLMISVDGLRPGDVFDAQQRGLKIPNLRSFVAQGSTATGVFGVLPTVTYPSHTTLITGVSPAKHGVVNNLTFDPMNINQQGWYWFASDIKVPTLWEAAHAKGLVTANVHWPVSVEAKGVDYNLPQIWHTGHPDDEKLVHALSTPGLLDALTAKLGPYARGIDDEIGGDETRGRFAVQLIADHKPDFATVYLTALDTNQHHFGPGSTEAHAALERIDAVVGTLVAAELKAHPDAMIAIVSDHGFVPTTTEVNLYIPFIQADLITVDDKFNIKAWDAVPWISGGSIAVVLKHPDDAALLKKVGDLLGTLKANPAMHIADVIGHDEIVKRGGNPQASFYVALQLDAMAGYKGMTPAGPSSYKGMHGHFPENPELQSVFMIKGARIPGHYSLGQIDMRSIAPTLAKLMGTSLPDAEKPPLF